MADPPLSPARAIELLGEGSPRARWIRLALLAAGLERPERFLDLDDGSAQADAPGGPFDVVWCGSRLDAMDPSAWSGFLQQLEQAIAPGGVIVFTVRGTAPARVCEQLAAAVPDLDLLLYLEDPHGGDGDDVVACRKRPA